MYWDDLIVLAITYTLTGLGRGQIDPGAWLISGLERCHLAWDVVRISPGSQQAKRGSAAVR